MEEFVVAMIAETEERNSEERGRLKGLRDAANPFLLSNRKFKKTFRLTSTSAKYLVEQIENHPDIASFNYIPKHLVVLGALHFFADGSYQGPVGADSEIGLSQPSMSRVLEATCNAIIDLLSPIYIRFPNTAEEKQSTMRDFLALYNMPNTLGAIDGSHVGIHKPSNNDVDAPGMIFYNRKGFYSINCQVVFNAKGKILSINPNFPGSTHDAAVWRSSSLSEHLEREFVRGHQDQWLLGDKGYPLLPWLMIPVSAPMNEAEERYNATHIQARNIVEMTFGRMKNKFRCMHKHRTLHYKPAKAARIIVACCTLYNMFSNVLSDDEEDSNSSSSESSDSSSSSDDDDSPLNEEDNGQYLNIARDKQQSLINYFR